MTYVITQPCIDVMDKSCVDVCPVDCIHEVARMLVIDPEECIDCRLCIPECPVDAIYAGDEVPADQRPYFEINARLALRWPVITRRRPLAGGDDWAAVKVKGHLLDPASAD